MPKIGSIGYWYKGDYQIPLLVMEELRKENIDVIDFSLGAIKASTFLSELDIDNLILLASEKRGKQELRIYKPEFEDSVFSDFLDVYSNLKAYYMDVDSFLRMARVLGALPSNLTVIECEVINEEGEISEWGKICKEMMKKEVLKRIRK
ncbi:hypothetical protein [Sulfurisphaera ohwakuensis]|uniref:Hydrogenase maturation protease n=1 Tax=Sulfurisphaera ohwakuensis TaxID=69656 RepID=A0A650CFS7_SULOH|nr:hypothetical protein [Sulfurisphaera ohwakuensis]MBB5254486.1 hypothetical protein [Sulfurisphaera ohwakuensis]QGR16710.1 hypothetical protein D1869_05555 [Sulfurisphaera ohwakuensis]